MFATQVSEVPSFFMPTGPGLHKVAPTNNLLEKHPQTAQLWNSENYTTFSMEVLRLCTISGQNVIKMVPTNPFFRQIDKCQNTNQSSQFPS
jgi:hypothetical protein